MKVSELGNEKDGYALLDYWVAKAEGYKGPCDAWVYSNLGSAGGPVLMNNGCSHKKCYSKETVDSIHGKIGGCPEFSSDWSQGGPIIEREKIQLSYPLNNIATDYGWDSFINGQKIISNGPTPLIAAMRARVASKYGDEVNE